MNKIRVIDLLNKIANGNIPKRIIYDEYVYQWNNIIKNYEREVDINTTLNWDYIAIECLNEEVEILEEEKKIPEKLIPTSLKGIDNLDEKIEIAHIDTISVIETLNQVIDYLKSKGDE